MADDEDADEENDDDEEDNGDDEGTIPLSLVSPMEGTRSAHEQTAVEQLHDDDEDEEEDCDDEDDDKSACVAVDGCSSALSCVEECACCC